MKVAQTLDRLVDIIQCLQANESQGLQIQPMERSFPFQCIVNRIDIVPKNASGFQIAIFEVKLEFENHDTCYIKSFRSEGHTFVVSNGASVNPLKVDCFEVRSTTAVCETVFDMRSRKFISISKDKDVYTKVSESEKIDGILQSNITQGAVVLNNMDLHLKTNANGDRITLKNSRSDWMDYLRYIVSPDPARFGNTF